MPQTRQQTQFAIEIYFLAALKAARSFFFPALYENFSLFWLLSPRISREHMFSQGAA